MLAKTRILLRWTWQPLLLVQLMIQGVERFIYLTVVGPHSVIFSLYLVFSQEVIRPRQMRLMDESKFNLLEMCVHRLLIIELPVSSFFNDPLLNFDVTNEVRDLFW